MDQKEKSQKVLAAEKKVLEAKAQLTKAKREETKKLRSQQNSRKYAMGGMVAKYFPECYDFSNEEMLRIIACAFASRDTNNMVDRVLRERNVSYVENEEEEAQDE